MFWWGGCQASAQHWLSPERIKRNRIPTLIKFIKIVVNVICFYIYTAIAENFITM
jgi:hypothetical protein